MCTCLGNRIFHIDLKGAAPKVDYFHELFQLLQKIGATGILIEWEDMFPFEGMIMLICTILSY